MKRLHRFRKPPPRPAPIAPVRISASAPPPKRPAELSEESWAVIELARWQLGRLPNLGDPPLDIPAAVRAIRAAFDGPMEGWIDVFNLQTVLSYLASRIDPNGPQADIRARLSQEAIYLRGRFPIPDDSIKLIDEVIATYE